MMAPTSTATVALAPAEIQVLASLCGWALGELVDADTGDDLARVFREMTSADRANAAAVTFGILERLTAVLDEHVVPEADR